VYVSRGSRVMVKFAYKPIEDKAELERLLMNEKAAYDKFSAPYWMGDPSLFWRISVVWRTSICAF
jgi:hypothetical protein